MMANPPQEWRRAAVVRAARSLAATSGTPRLDAELLMARAMGTTREALLLGADGPVPDSFSQLLARRLAHEPMAYILGMRDFWSLTLTVTPAVLIPRPDSEALIAAAVDHWPTPQGTLAPKRILDLGTGSGALLLAALTHWPAAAGVGVDRSSPALDVARANAQNLGLDGRAQFRLGDWAGGIEERFDLILCNPPYVETTATLDPQVANHEPAEALFAGPDGLDDYRRLAGQLGERLKEDGAAFVEIGATQAASVTALFRQNNLLVRRIQDLAGHDRCLIVTPDQVRDGKSSNLGLVLPR